MTFSGVVETGRGEASAFTRIGWVREQAIERLGIDPFPGTLNLRIDDDEDHEAWRALAAEPGIRLDAPDGGCGARTYPVRVRGRLPAAIVRPDVDGYPPRQVELMAAVPIRESLSLEDGDLVRVERCGALAVRAVLFDVDGTLVDSMTSYLAVAERVAAAHGLGVAEAIVREALNTNRSFWDLVLRPDHPDRASLIRTLTRTASDLWPEVLAEYGRLFPDVPALLDTLQARGARLAIVTGGESLGPIRDAGLLDRFEAIVTMRHVKRRKPDPEGLLTCAAALDIDPADAVYVGDTPVDIHAGRAAGMYTVGLLAGAGDSALLSASGPDRVVSSHAQLPDVFDIR